MSPSLRGRSTHPLFCGDEGWERRGDHSLGDTLGSVYSNGLVEDTTLITSLPKGEEAWRELWAQVFKLSVMQVSRDFCPWWTAKPPSSHPASLPRASKRRI